MLCGVGGGGGSFGDCGCDGDDVCEDEYAKDDD